MLLKIKLISILSLTNDIIKIQNTGIIHNKTENELNDIYSAILSHDYITVLKLDDGSEKVISILLNDIVEFITEFNLNEITSFISKPQDIDKICEKFNLKEEELILLKNLLSTYYKNVKTLLK